MKKGGIAAHNLYPLVVIAGLVPAIQFLETWTTGTSPVVTMEGRLSLRSWPRLLR